MFQVVLTPSAGKRLIAKAIIEHQSVISAIEKGTLVIIAGTTNGYIAEEILKSLGRLSDFNRNYFIRGVVLPPAMETTEYGRLPDESKFPGDVVISKGNWQKGKTIFDIVDGLKEGDVILKGANCVNPIQKKAGILIGHPKGGTIGAAMQAVIGRRVKLIVPVGLEKRIFDDVDEIARIMNEPGASGPRLFPVSGEIITEIEAVELLFGLKAKLVAGGGVCGAEGSIRLAITGDKERLDKAQSILSEINKEKPFEI